MPRPARSWHFLAFALTLFALQGVVFAQARRTGTRRGGTRPAATAPATAPAPPTPPPATPPPAAEPPAPEPPVAATPPAPAPTPTSATTDCQGTRIGQVRFSGLARLSASDLRGSLRVRDGSCVTRELLQGDAHTLWALDFFTDVQVAIETSDDDPDAAPDVVFTVTERRVIREIKFEGNDNIETDKLKENLQLREGSVVTASSIQRAEQKLRDDYIEKGYFLAEIHATVEPRAGSDNEADIVFHIRENAQVQIRSITFVGNLNVPADELRGVMTTGVGSFFSFLTQAGTYREEAFRNDMDLLHAAYYDRGYLTVDIEQPRIALSADRQFLDFTIVVHEGPRFRLGRVRVVEVDESEDEVEPLGGRRRVREMLHADPGDYFSRQNIGRDILALQAHYRDQGYANVDVSPDIRPRVDNATVDLSLRIRRGHLTYIDRIVIRGNQKTSDRVIRREMPILEGEVYNESRYQDAKRRIQQLGFFERVDMSTEIVPDHPDRVIVNVEVVERPTGTFQVGAGVSSVEAFILTAQIQQLNLFGRGQQFSLQAQVSALRQIFQLSFVEPYLWDSKWSGSISLYNMLRAYADFTRLGTGGTASVGYPLIGMNDLRLSLSYTAEQVSITTRGSATLLGGQQVQSAFAQVPLTNLLRSGFTSALGASLVLDTRDNRMFPTSGLYARLGVEVADPYTGSQNTYVRLTGNFRFYIPVVAGVVIKGNLMGGWIESRTGQGVPIFERYFVGGILDLRGYRLRTVGPRVPVPSVLDPNAAVNADGTNIGGNVQLVYNLEVEFPIVNAIGLRGVIFHDAGNAFNTESRYCNASIGAFGDPSREVINPCWTGNPLALRTSVGFGFRWFSPLGLLRFEWGFPLARYTYEEPSVFEFSIGNLF